MSDDWLDSLGLACLVLVGSALLMGLFGLAILVQAASGISGEMIVGSFVLSLALPMMNKVLLVAVAGWLGSSPHPGLRAGGVVMLAAALTRMFGE